LPDEPDLIALQVTDNFLFSCRNGIRAKVELKQDQNPEERLIFATRFFTSTGQGKK